MRAGVRVSDVEPLPVRWLWKDRIPLGKLTVLDGDPGLGKSTLALDIAARVTTGAPFPDGPSPPKGGAVLLSAEDDIADTIRPRLETANADLERVVIFERVPLGMNNHRPPQFPKDLDRLAGFIDEEDAKLVVIDPLVAFLPAQVDSMRDQDVRGALHPLKQIAEMTGAAILFLRHLNKSGGFNPLYRGGGSIGIIGAARAGLVVAPDPGDETRRVVAVSKSNLAPHPPSLAFRLVSDELRNVATIRWDGTTDLKATDLLAEPVSEDEKGAEADAVTFLEDLLSSGPMPATEVCKRADAEGHSRRTLKRAKSRLRVRSSKEGEPGSSAQRWVWVLPEGAQGPSPNGAKGLSQNPRSETKEAKGAKKAAPLS